MRNYLLLIEDNQFERNLYERILEGHGYRVYTAENLKSAAGLLSTYNFPVVIVDISLPDGNGLEYVKSIKTSNPKAEVILFTSGSNVKDAIKAMKYGAFDYLTKGEDSQRLINLIQEAMLKSLANNTHLNINKNVKPKGFDAMIGSSDGIKIVKALAIKVANTNTPVLLLGETGVGKDVLAESIHKASKRAAKNFLAINCSAIGHEMLESEFFGYKAGAFTGALKDKKGLLEEADEGTVFLDEIGEMSMPLQAKLLRFLENGSFIKLGDTKTTYTNCRIIAATNVNLKYAVKAGKFREDLYYRITAFTIVIPPLRERKTDIPILVDYFIAKLAKEFEMEQPRISQDFIGALMKYSWPGNIRELINVLKKSLILSSGTLDPELVELTDHNEMETVNLDELQLKTIKQVIKQNNGDKRKAARQLGISIATLYRKI